MEMHIEVVIDSAAAVALQQNLLRCVELPLQKLSQHIS